MDHPMPNPAACSIRCLASRSWGRALFALVAGIGALVGAAHVQAAEADMQVSAYTWSPDPVVHGGAAAFSLTVQNNGPAASTGSTLTINLPSNVTYAGNASGCTPSAGDTVLTCPVGALGIAQTASVAYTATGGVPGAQNTSASLVDNTAGNTDANAANNALPKLVTTIAGADLQFASHTGPASANAGDSISFVLTARNGGPDPASQFRVTNSLPAAVDFQYQSASGAGWSCSHAAAVVTCDYTGAAIAGGADAPAITITGRVITTAGTVTNGASVAGTDPQTGDPVPGNNTANNVTVTVNDATDLRANKSMISAALGAGTVFLSGEAVTLRLSASNTGVRNASGVTVGDTVPADFVIGAPLPGGCSALGQAITCAVGNLNAGLTSANFDIPLTAAAVGAATAGSNTASVSRAGPALGNNQSTTVNYTLTPPYAHLVLGKSKTGGPILAGQNLTSTITVTNSASSTAAATGTVTVVDTLTDYPNETYVSVAAPWSCVDSTAVDKRLTCTYAIPGSLAIGASLPNLVITTQVAAGFGGGSLANTVTHANTHAPADNDPSSSATASTYGTNQQADLAIAKAVSDSDIDTAENSVGYTLTVSNNGPDPAATVTVSDPIPVWFSGNVNGAPASTGGSVSVSGGLGAGESCSGIGATVTCTLKNLANGASRDITIALTRPFASGGPFTNTASVTSPDTVETNAGNNTAQATVTSVAAIADVAVTSVAASLDPVKAGVEEQFTVNIKNLGANPAAGAVVEIPVDTGLVNLVAGSIQLTGAGGSCTTGSNNLTDPGWGGARSGIRCTGFSLASDEARQVIFRVMPKYPYPDNNGGDPSDGAYATDARISTSTTESSAANNAGGKTVLVTNAQLDLAVTKQEALGYDPDAGGPLSNQLHDPVAFGDQIVYRVTLRNNGPSQAGKVQVVDTPTPPGGGYTVSFVSAALDAGNSNYTPTNGVNCAIDTPAAGQVTCWLGNTAGDHSDSILPANKFVAINLTFATGGGSTPSGSLTYSNTAAVSSDETVAGLDSLPLNNTVVETTTVLPRTDLYVSKSVSQATVDLNEPFTYTLTVGNKGGSDAAGVRVSDTLPSGFVMAGAVSVIPGGGVSLGTNSCTAPAVGSGGSLSCDLGTIPADATGADAARQVVITVPMRAAYQTSGGYAFAFNSNIANTASVAPLPNTSIDPVADNNSGSVNVQVRKNSLAGTVYTDNNLNDVIDGGEAINAVTLTLTGTDAYGNTYQGGGTYPALTTTSNTSGVFTFDNLPPGTWSVVQTQPSGYWDRFETVGSAGGTAPASTCDGTTNCAAGAAANTIGAIVLAADTATAASGYVFQEVRRALLSGYVYHDANNDGDRGAGEPGIASLANHVTLSGTAYNGVDVCTLVTCTLTLDASGQYSYANLPPSNGAGYTLTQNTQPAGYLDGQEQQGDGIGNVEAASAGRAAPESLTGLTLTPNQTRSEHNFGELLPATLSGFVFIDADGDALRDAGETAGVTGVTVRLTGTDDLGNAIDTTTTTAANGGYSFGGLRPGSYAVNETPPAGLTHTGAQAGAKGGTINGVARAAGTGVTGAFADITAITIASGDTASGYNFGESGQGLAGFVYVDLNSNGSRDPGEPGIPGVQITLSGSTNTGADVCVVINPSPCTVTTDASGAYSYTGLPQSNGAGYTLSQQSQAAAPLSNYVDGGDTLGSLGGTAGNDQFSGIVLPSGGFGSDYNFGEGGASLSGRVYDDKDDNGGFNAGDSGLPGVTITLSGTTASGQNVCAVIPSCTVTTAADGTYGFTGLPAGTYTLTQTQPLDYADRATSVGSPGGTGSTGTSISGITLSTGQDGSGYLFGEKTGALGGFVYHDMDNDGVRDASEPGINGVTLTLSGTTASGVDVCTLVTCAVTTDVNGAYGIPGLPNAGAGGYTLTETPPAGWLDGRETAGGQGGTVDNSGFDASAGRNRIGAIPFNAASAANDYNFGEVQSGGLAGRIWHDADNDGAYDPGEEMASVSITLTGTDDQGQPVNLTLVTGADGTYGFTGLRPSDGTGYTLTETQPNGIGDFPGAAGTQTGSLGGTAVVNAVSGIVLGSGQSGTGYDFRENASALSGFVYRDDNDDGGKGVGELGIAGVTVTLTGTDANGAPVNRAATTAADGGYRFLGLSSGSYTLTETHPVIYEDGREAAGSPAGTVDNMGFDTSVGRNRIGAITLPAATVGTGYLFGERIGLPAQVSGKVWLDADHQRDDDDGACPALPNSATTICEGWTVQIIQRASPTATVFTLIDQTTTDANGNYSFSGIPAGSYEIRFLHPNTNQVFGRPVSGAPGVDLSYGTIYNLTLASGDNVLNQSLPLDPSGVVYDSVRREPIAGATVTLLSGGGTVPAACLVGLVNPVTTDASGQYQFLLLNPAPVGCPGSGVYTLQVTQPAGYLPPNSTIIPPTAGPYTPTLGGVDPIQAQATQPTGLAPTVYYTSFLLTLTGNPATSSSSVVNNHIPLDPITTGAITVLKTTPLLNVSKGDLVPYTLRYTAAFALPGVALHDLVPPGFKYKSGSARLDGVAAEPMVNGRQLTWSGVNFAASQTHTIRLLLVVGAGVGEGEYTNQAWATRAGSVASNTASATVRVVPDPTFDCSDLIGKVFDDRNANGWQDEGEPGIANVRLATARGLLVTTDAEGRYHVACAAIPQAQRGSNFIMKLDERTLPSGYRLTTENPREVRMTRGKLVKLNFGAAIHRVVRLELSDAAFLKDSADPDAALARALDRLPASLREKPSVLRLAYRRAGEGDARIQARLRTVRQRLERLWKDSGCCYSLQFEEEIFERAVNRKGGAQ
jgi:uncharacterized repeat protein (TIGR01451 family)